MFAPTWIVKQQNDEIEKYFLEDALESYISRKWLEITCGEAPYMASRYEMEAVIHNMSNSPPIIAQKVIEGEFGNGEERVKRLTEAGYDATEVQEEVNRMMSEEGGERVMKILIPKPQNKIPIVEYYVESKKVSYIETMTLKQLQQKSSKETGVTEKKEKNA